MTLRERLERGSERRRRQVPVSEFRRRTDLVLAGAVPAKDPRPVWLQRGVPERDETFR
jgi:hypothetical protein